MKPSPRAAVAAAEAIVRRNRAPVCVPAPPVPEAPPAAGTVRMLGPQDPPPFDRVHPAPLWVRAWPVLLVIVLFALASWLNHR